MFTDSVTITIKSGKGGNGHVSFRREKYVPNGGPDGGDGGKGGDIIFEVDPGMNTLNDFRHKRKWMARNGEEGGKRNCHGKKGEDLVIKVPEGTIIRDEETGEVIMDMSGDHKRELILPGGRGGNGNQHYATSTMQAPKYAQPGQEAIELQVRLELKVIADVGLVGFPSVGKSTLLSMVSNATPKIADYHFTTLQPILGVVDLGDGEGFVMADIPGLIEGARDGVGLGHDFLRHIERTRVLIHVVDVAGTEGRDPVSDVYAIHAELSAFEPMLLQKPMVIAANKMDALPADSDALERLKKEFEPQGIKVFPISAAQNTGIRELLYAVGERLRSAENQKTLVYESTFDPKLRMFTEEPVTVRTDPDGAFVVEGPKIEKMLGYTNLESEKGFLFFQRFLREQGILKELEAKGIKEGDTVRLSALEFTYYP